MSLNILKNKSGNATCSHKLCSFQRDIKKTKTGTSLGIFIFFLVHVLEYN